LVKNSIISVEQPDQQLEDDDVFDDLDAVQHMVSAASGCACACVE
jgi:hypothetical protein